MESHLEVVSRAAVQTANGVRAAGVVGAGDGSPAQADFGRPALAALLVSQLVVRLRPGSGRLLVPVQGDYAIAGARRQARDFCHRLRGHSRRCRGARTVPVEANLNFDAVAVGRNDAMAVRFVIGARYSRPAAADWPATACHTVAVLVVGHAVRRGGLGVPCHVDLARV